ncbi:MAG: ribonuclease P protein component [Bacteroidales bacterium]|nr:ribonuclease P protein component [Bacteroidales bacterium]
MTQTLSKRERLSGKTAIGTLMKKGRWGSAGSLKYCVMTPGGDEVTRIMVSVSKRNFKRAVKRNLLKRRLRESYRTQKELLCGAGPVDLLFVYNSKEIIDYATIREDVAQILRSIAGAHEEEAL